MSAPHVAGLLSLVYQMTPKISVGDAADIVSRTALDVGEKGNDNTFGWGRVDAFSAVRAGKAFRRRQ